MSGLQDEATALLQRLVRVDTSNPPGHETPAALVLRDYLEAHGVACELVARDPERANLVARLPGEGAGPSLALLGHLDVVPADAAGWTRPPFSGHLDADGFLWGRGTADMKNELATRAVVLAALAREGFRPRGDLLLVAAADEEDGTSDVGVSWLVRKRPDLRVDYVLNEGPRSGSTWSTGGGWSRSRWGRRRPPACGSPHSAPRQRPLSPPAARARSFGWPGWWSGSTASAHRQRWCPRHDD